MNFFCKIFFVLIPFFTFAQIEFGFKTGINLNNSSDITIITQDFDTSFTKDDFQGYFIGGFISLEGAVFNLRSELQYNKIKNSNNSHNTNGATYIYMAFAENPFKNSLAR